jgi:hypothetical protein
LTFHFVEIGIIISEWSLGEYISSSFIISSFAGFEVLIISVPNQPIVEMLTSAFYLIFGTFLPFAVISICNIIIIVTVKQAAKNRLNLGQTQKTTDIREKTNNTKHHHERTTAHLTRMLISISAAYVVTALPLRIHYFVMDIPEVASMYDLSTSYWTLRYILENAILAHLWFWNHAINFYLYIVAGGRKFRNDTKQVLRKLVYMLLKARN